MGGMHVCVFVMLMWSCVKCICVYMYVCVCVEWQCCEWLVAGVVQLSVLSPSMCVVFMFCDCRFHVNT